MSDKISVLISEEDVEKRIQEIGSAISKEYEGKCVHLICVLKGGVFFACELAKRISVPVTMDFMSVSSYGDDTKSSGVVKIVKDLDQPLEYIADTTAMGTPHEISYDFTFHRDSIGSKDELPQEAAKKVVAIALAIIVGGGILNHYVKKKNAC